MKTIIFTIIFSFTIIGCKKQTSNYKSNADAFLLEMEQSTGDTFSVAKLDTEMFGYVVYKNETTSEYVAYNILKWETDQTFSSYLSSISDSDYITDLEMHAPGVQTVWREYIIDYDDYTYSYPSIYNSYYDTYYTDRPPTSYGSWKEVTHTSNYFTGGGFTFDESRSLVKDLETKLGEDENENIKTISNVLDLQYGLGEEKSLNLAKLYSQYNELSNLRNLSEEEKKEFEIDAFGVSFKEFEKAYIDNKKGDNTNFKSLIQQASEFNQLEPEVVRSIIEQMF